ncbi:MAG TPA: alpha/beta hydrolase [Solirubrobacteraceae bacterium]|jgi:pimeloyl-ACP methyl ester carboxylesterase|nr:alpha/beta hydrolase [Solirubrobacteraceae bacterium]
MPSGARPARELSFLTDDRVALFGEEAGGEDTEGSSREAEGEVRAGAGGVPIVLLHGLTATRRYVVMGSRLLERSGYRVIAYDARGHGRSGPALDPRAYGYERLARDLGCVLDALEIPRAALAGASMGAHTILRFALEHPERVAAMGLVTPSFDPSDPTAAVEHTGDVPATGARALDASFEGDREAGVGSLAGGREAEIGPPEGSRGALARGLRDGGVEGFLRAYDFSTVPPAWRETVETVVRQRLCAHEHPEAVADALEVVPRSRPFEDFAELGAIAAPTVVVASRDEVDPGHPLAVAERYARAIPGATLTVEDGGVGGQPIRSPIAWQGGQLSKVLLELLGRARCEQ